MQTIPLWCSDSCLYRKRQPHARGEQGQDARGEQGQDARGEQGQASDSKLLKKFWKVLKF